MSGQTWITYSSSMEAERRKRVTVLLVRDGQLLALYREKNGFNYYVTIGGGIEPGETPEQAARREVKEETSLDVTLGPLLWQNELGEDQYEYVYLVTEFQGQPRLGPGPEKDNQSADNVYRLVWLPLAQLSQVTLFPGPVDVPRLVEAVAL